MDIDRFIRDGYVVVRGAFEAETAAACREEIWRRIAPGGVTEDPTTWTRPVVRIDCPDTEPFVVAGTAESLWDAYDTLIGEGRWTRRAGVGGTIPIRFPSEDYPDDVGYHIEGSWWDGEGYRANVRSRACGLLALFLFSDVGEDDAPTRLMVGSHLSMPTGLATAGEGWYERR